MMLLKIYELYLLFLSCLSIFFGLFFLPPLSRTLTQEIVSIVDRTNTDNKNITFFMDTPIYDIKS